MTCERCGHIMVTKEEAMERHPDQLNSIGRHRWLRFYWCRECGHRETIR